MVSPGSPGIALRLTLMAKGYNFGGGGLAKDESLSAEKTRQALRQKIEERYTAQA